MLSPNYKAIADYRDEQNAINALASRVAANGIKLDSPEQLLDIIRRQQQQQ